MILQSLRLSLLVVSITTVVIAVAGTAFAYLLAKRRFRGREMLDALLTLPMVLPPTVTGYYLILLLGRRGCWGTAVRPDRMDGDLHLGRRGHRLGRSGASLMIKSARAAIESVDPEYETASC